MNSCLKVKSVIKIPNLKKHTISTNRSILIEREIISPNFQKYIQITQPQFQTSQYKRK